MTDRQPANQNTKGFYGHAPNSLVFEILMRQLTVQSAQLTEDARLEEDLGADSLDKVEIFMALEECFDLAVPDERAETVNTVGDVFELLSELRQSRQCVR